MLRVGDLQLSRLPRHRVAQIVERALGRPQPVRPVATPRTGASAVIARPANDLRRGQILDPPDTFGGITNIASRAIHDHSSKKHSSRKYRSPSAPKVKKSSVIMLQSLFPLLFRGILR